MSKLCASEIRTGPNGANFEFTGEDGDLTNINIGAVRVLARKLAERAGQRTGTLDAEGSRAYQQLASMIKRYQNTGRPYEEIYDVIVDEFQGVGIITPGTVGEVFMGCIRSSGCGTSECNPACINSILQNPDNVGKSCQVNVYSADSKGDLQLMGSRIHNSTVAHVYIQHNMIITDKMVRDLKQAGITQVVIYSVQPDGVCLPLHDGRTVGINEVAGNGQNGGRKGGCRWGNCGGNTSDVTSGEESSSWSWWWWAIVAIIIVVIIVIIIVLLIAFALRNSAKKGQADPDGCSNFQRHCATMYSRIC